MRAGERSHAVNQFDGVMSHSFKSSPLSGTTAEPKLPKLGMGIQPMCQPRESVDPIQFFILRRQDDGNRMRFLSRSIPHLCRTGCHIFRLQVERRRKASGRISIDL